MRWRSCECSNSLRIRSPTAPKISYFSSDQLAAATSNGANTRKNSTTRIRLVKFRVSPGGLSYPRRSHPVRHPLGASRMSSLLQLVRMLRFPRELRRCAPRTDDPLHDDARRRASKRIAFLALLFAGHLLLRDVLASECKSAQKTTFAREAHRDNDRD